MLTSLLPFHDAILAYLPILAPPLSVYSRLTRLTFFVLPAPHRSPILKNVFPFKISFLFLTMKMQMFSVFFLSFELSYTFQSNCLDHLRNQETLFVLSQITYTFFCLISLAGISVHNLRGGDFSNYYNIGCSPFISFNSALS